MKRSDRATRRYVRQRRSLLSEQREIQTNGPDAGSLVERAGRADVEQLEPRQMLFSLTIGAGDVNPATGIGTQRAYFGYRIPYLIPVDDIDLEIPDVREEDFNDEPIGPIGDGQLLLGSRVRVQHNVIVPQNFRIETDVEGRLVHAELAPQEFFSFTPLNENEDAPFTVMMTQIQFDITAGEGSAVGLDLDNIRVRAFFRGDVVGEFTGAALGAMNVANPGTGVGTFVFAAGNGISADAFDTLEVRAVDGPTDAFHLDTMFVSIPAGNFADFVDAGVRGAEIVISGRVGASVQVLDLAGRDMLNSLALGIPLGGNLPLIDLDDNGIANYNDGIGKIIISGSDAATSVTIFGGLIAPADERPDDALDFRSGFAFTAFDAILGFYDEFEAENGFGYWIDLSGDQPEVGGLPPGPGSLVIGAPWYRDPTNTDTYGTLTFPPGAEIDFFPGQGLAVVGGFTRPDQGIFVTGGNSIGNVYVHGVVHGSSHFTGAADQVVIGYLVGSLTVDGDLGRLIIGSDSGLWAPEPDAGLPFDIDPIIKTDGQLVVGRSLGQIAIAGRSLMDVTVIGDLHDATQRPPRDIFRYFETEFSTGVYGLDEDNEEVDAIRVILSDTPNESYGLNAEFPPSGFFARNGQPIIFGNGFFRNDAILSAEWVGSIGTAVQVNGELGFGGPVNTAEDVADVYAFAVDGQSEIVVELNSSVLDGVYSRILDADGRTLAATQAPLDFQDAQFLRFSANAPGVYYLVVSTPGDADLTTGDSYVLTLSGMAPVMLGAYRTGASSGENNFLDQVANNVEVRSGSAGSIRVGTALVGRGGTEVSPREILNTDVDEDDDLLVFRGGTFSIPGNLYNITTGSDIEGGLASEVNIFVNGNFGTLITGLSPVAGDIGPGEGDVDLLTLNVGGSIAMLDIRGGIGIDQDPDIADGNVISLGTIDGVNIFTGTSGGRGDIGMIRVGSHIGGDTLNVTTSDGSVIGAFLVSQDAEYDRADPLIGLVWGTDGATFTLGSGSDVRFVDFPQIDLEASVDFEIPLFANIPVLVTDDGGGTVEIMIIGGGLGIIGNIRYLPIDRSQGVAIAEIEVDLTGGARLQIVGQGSRGSTDVISLGHIVILGADADSSIGIIGDDQIDVWMIEQLGGAAFADILNDTPNGDIVAIDVVGVSRVEIRSGDLGRTQLPEWGPSQLGPYLGIAQAAGGVGGTFGVPANNIDGNWNGELYRPVNNADDGTAYLDDVGSPLDPYLNGLIARTGDILSVLVGGAVGDVVAAAGDIIIVEANFDNVTPHNGFDGIIGSIYANNIRRVEIGDGLLQRTSNGLSTTGIFANDDLTLVIGERIEGAYISSTISAGDNVVEAGTGEFQGIDRVELNTKGGDFIDAYISATNLDEFWISLFFGDDRRGQGNVNDIIGRQADFFRSTLSATSLNRFQLIDGYYDASVIQMRADADFISTAGYRNSTLTGGDLEFHQNEVVIGRTLDTLTVFGFAGDIVDLRIDVSRRVTGEISAFNISRADIDVDNQLVLLRAEGSIRGSSITVGHLIRGEAKLDFRTTEFLISGPLEELIAIRDITNTTISVTGPDGRIEALTAGRLLSGNISASGPINRISAGWDIIANITTTTSRGNIGIIEAGRDLDLTTDISGTASRLIAGRHFGNQADPSVILVRGNIELIDVSNGQMYSDVRIGESLTGSLTIGAVSAKPGNNLTGSGSLIAFGRINQVNVTGDFAGDIISQSGGIGSVTIVNGSFLQDGLIAAYDGNITDVIITGGHLLGNIHADYILYSVRVNASADGTFGDIGINPDLSANVSYDAMRNQLPAGVGANNPYQGASITAGWNIGTIFVENGSIFETTIHAKRAIGFIDVNGDIRNDNFSSGFGSLIAAGDSIHSITVSGSMRDTVVLAGVLDLGDDGRAGGTGADADRLKSGWINTVQIGGNTFNVAFSSGLTAGADGQYNTIDDLVVTGVSFINTVTVGGTVTSTSAFTDAHFVSIAPGITTGGQSFALADGQVDPQVISVGVSIVGSLAFAYGSDTGTISFTGPGTAYWDVATGRVVLVNTSLDSELVITSASGQLTDFDIVSNDDASIGLLRVEADMYGNSDIVIDGFVQDLQFGSYFGDGRITIGGDVGSITTGSVLGGAISAKFVGSVFVSGDYGTILDDSELTLNILGTGGITITGINAGVISVDRDLGGLSVGGAMSRAAVRVGSSVGPITAASLSETWISVADNIGPVTINGNAFDSSIMAGTDLGTDAKFGGQGTAADSVTTGSIVSVFIGGSFIESDIVEGIIRGPDAFFGTSDDSLAGGRGSIGNIVIGGQALGSNLNSEGYLIASTGSLGTVSSLGQKFQGVDNFDVQAIRLDPVPIQIEDTRVIEDSGDYIAWIYFNQPMNSAALVSALSVLNVNAESNTTTHLLNAVDYRLEYDVEEMAAKVIFSRAVTERDMPTVPGVPGPGIYRFEMDPELTQATVVTQRLDGDGDGFATDGDMFSGDDIVGDAGDKLESTRQDLYGFEGDFIKTVDFYGPISLDIVLDDNASSDGLPDTNIAFDLRGSIGDHPDVETDMFGFGADLDLYQITLQSGQILRLGQMNGAAQFATRALINANGSILASTAGLLQTGGLDGEILALPNEPGTDVDRTVEDVYLIKNTGTYYLLVGNPMEGEGNSGFFFDQANAIPNLGPVPGGTGSYMFTVEVFDDGNSGFAAPTDGGSASRVVDAPAVGTFAGPDGTFGTLDDLTQVKSGGFTFTLNTGDDGVAGTIDDLVSGSNGSDITSTQDFFGQMVSTVQSGIGPLNHAGLPGEVFADVDVYDLNNGRSIDPGTKIRITVRLADLGSDLGSRTQFTFEDFNGHVQLGVFDTTDAADIDDAVLVFSPTDFAANGGTPGVIADNGETEYGYDDNGDFYIEFAAPGKIGDSASAASYAVMLQGAFNADYELEIVTNGTGQIAKRTQNVFIETRGGFVDWLESGGLTTTFKGFSASALGFTGTVNNVPIDEVIKAELVTSLESVFSSAGLDVRFSTNPADFEMQDFSTVFISNSNDPVSFFFDGIFGFAEHSDPFNADRNDEGIVFVPSLAVLGYTPSNDERGDLVDSLTSAIGRRVGELLGLRTDYVSPLVGGSGDLMGSNSVGQIPDADGRYFLPSMATLSRPFDSLEDTNFYLGRQNSLSLLDRYIADQ